MHPDVQQTDTGGLAYLARITELHAEVQLAMEAIGANALSTLEQSVSRQQALCADLQRIAGAIPALQDTKGAAHRWTPASASDDLLSRRIEVAGESLAALNLRYSALLEHSRQSLRLFAGLCRGYAEHFEPAAKLRVAQPGWSCQL